MLVLSMLRVKTVHHEEGGGEGVKKWQNDVHVVVE